LGARCRNEPSPKCRRPERRAAPLIKTAAALEACLLELTRLLIAKKVIEPQEALDAFSDASGSIQNQPDSDVGVQTVERLCAAIAMLPGAKRSMS
jgi:hypothetical protein